MKERFKSWYFIAGTILLIASISVVVAQTRTPATDFKVRYKVTMSGPGMPGQTSETVTMIKKARERSENHTGYGFDSVTITQCDLKRTIQVSDSAKKYVVTPMDNGEPPQRTAPSAQAPAPTTPTRQGGTVEYVSGAIDTGERKEMYGFTARHIKTSMSINPSPDSCSPGKRKIELDGWYIDLNVEFNCDVNRAQVMTASPSRVGCKDKVITRREGNAKTGFPLIETMKMFGEDGQVTMSQTREVVELSRASLDTALFEIPPGYTEASSTSELYGAPSIASMMKQAQQEDNPTTTNPIGPSMSAATATVKKPGSLLIGVVQFNNKAGRQVSLFELRQRLITQLEANGASAIALNASSQMEADVEAKAKECDFILYTDLAALKMNKLGGMFGNIAGVGGMAKAEAKLEFRLFAVGETTPRLKSSASAKEEGEENSAGVAIDTEARMVAAEVKKPK